MPISDVGPVYALLLWASAYVGVQPAALLALPLLAAQPISHFLQKVDFVQMVRLLDFALHLRQLHHNRDGASDFGRRLGRATNAADFESHFHAGLLRRDECESDGFGLLLRE